MEIIPEYLVEETWLEVAKFEAERAHAEMVSVSRIQPILIAFMIEICCRGDF